MKIDKIFEILGQLNWKLFVVTFVAGFIGVILTHGGIHVPKQLNPLSSESVKSELFGK